MADWYGFASGAESARCVTLEIESALSELMFNPYDFANPVDSAEMFAGRKSETDEVKYYLDYARHARPIHLAVTGERAAGKTSMLNLIQREAELLGFLVVRMDLNESDTDPLQFFGGLYDAILTEAVSKGAYAGTSGHLYKAYRRLTDTGEAVDLPLAFPGHLVATSSGTRNLSRPILTSDMKLISAEVGRPIVIVLDECNVLTQSRITLEMIRNLFMNLDGFMLVIAGTPSLFPVIDDVYSPIARQFKKVELNPFESEKETKECVCLPLSHAGVDPEDFFESLPFIVSEIHRISGGRPYEIQLLCHTMFKRMQQGKEHQLDLNLETLETVRKELELRQGHDNGRVSHLYAELTDDDLATLSMLRRLRGGQPKDALNMGLALEDHLFASVTEEVFYDRLSHLKLIGVIEEEANGLYRLAGDQFDEVYLRYLAASRDVFIVARPFTFNANVHGHVMEILDVPYHEQVHHEWLGLSGIDFDKRLQMLLSSSSKTGVRPSAASLGDWEKIYQPMDVAQRNGHEELTYLQVRVEIGSLQSINHYNVTPNQFEFVENSKPFQDFVSRVEARQGIVTTKRISYSLKGLAPVAELVPQHHDLLQAIWSQYESLGLMCYRERRYLDASEAFERAFELVPASRTCVEIAFHHLLMEKWESAIDWTYRADFCSAREGFKDNDQIMLSAFNRAVGHLMLGQVQQARLELEALIDDGAENGPVFLRVPERQSDGTWRVEDGQGSIVETSIKLISQL